MWGPAEAPPAVPAVVTAVHPGGRIDLKALGDLPRLDGGASVPDLRRVV